MKYPTIRVKCITNEILMFADSENWYHYPDFRGHYVHIIKAPRNPGPVKTIASFYNPASVIILEKE